MATEVIETRQKPLGDVERKQRVQRALRSVGSHQRECARALGLSDGDVSRIVARLQHAHTEEVEAWICMRTGKTREELFEGMAAVGAGNAVE